MDANGERKHVHLITKENHVLISRMITQCQYNYH